jgi:transposase InsO family protein
MDLIVELPASSRGYTAIVTFVDRFSKMVHFRPCQTSSSAADIAALFLEMVVCRYGCPAHVVSDRDPRFVSHFWQAVLDLLGVKQSLSTAYHPESDGQSERMHRTIEQILRCYVSPLQSDWDLYLPCAEFAMNASKSSATQHSPFEVVFGR